MHPKGLLPVSNPPLPFINRLLFFYNAAHVKYSFFFDFLVNCGIFLSFLLVAWNFFVIEGPIVVRVLFFLFFPFFDKALAFSQSRKFSSAL